MIQIHSLIVRTLILFMAVIMSSCDQSVDPIIGEDRPFTIWGYLDAHDKIQRVRVFPIRDQFETNHSDSIDATVTSTNLTTGEVYAWVAHETGCCSDSDSIGGQRFPLSHNSL